MTVSIKTFALAIAVMTSAAFSAAQAKEPAQQSHSQERASTVAENVKNDLADWRKAGFDAHSYDALSYNVFGPEYQRRFAKYQELKQLHARAATKSE